MLAGRRDFSVRYRTHDSAQAVVLIFIRIGFGLSVVLFHMCGRPTSIKRRGLGLGLRCRRLHTRDVRHRCSNSSTKPQHN